MLFTVFFMYLTWQTRLTKKMKVTLKILIYVALAIIPSEVNGQSILQRALDAAASFLRSTVSALKAAAQKLTFDRDVTEVHISIYLHNSNGNYTKYLISNSELPNQINTAEDIIIIIHGWQHSGIYEWVQNMAAAFHKAGKVNVISFDWNELAYINYISATLATRRVGELMGEWILNKLAPNNTAILDKVHIVGHSLGAHIAGFAGSFIYNVSRTLVRNITGLDPAGPLFEKPLMVAPERRLDPSDAKFVDVYHSCSGVIGFSRNLGHQDFYINNGAPVQPGCLTYKVDQILRCSHLTACRVYTKMISSTDYVATPCKRKMFNLWGATCDKNTTRIIAGRFNRDNEPTGSFYLYTDSDGNPIHK